MAKRYKMTRDLGVYSLEDVIKYLKEFNAKIYEFSVIRYMERWVEGVYDERTGEWLYDRVYREFVEGVWHLILHTSPVERNSCIIVFEVASESRQVIEAKMMEYQTWYNLQELDNILQP